MAAPNDKKRKQNGSLPIIQSNALTSPAFQRNIHIVVLDPPVPLIESAFGDTHSEGEDINKLTKSLVRNIF